MQGSQEPHEETVEIGEAGADAPARRSGSRRRGGSRKPRIVGVAVAVAVVVAVVAGFAVAGSDDDKKPAAATAGASSSSPSASTSPTAGAEDPPGTGAPSTGPSPDDSATPSATPSPTVSRTTASGSATPTATGTPRTSPESPTTATTAATRPTTPPPAPAQATVPNVTGLGYADAASRLTAQGFTVARADEVSAKPAGTVLRTAPGAGAVVPKGTKVTVAVAKADDTMTVVPQIADMYIRDARAALRAVGLALEDMYNAPGYDEGGVYSHCRLWQFTPGEGAKVKKGTVIDVTRVYGCG
ncbi:PASTA domain-containing protein [Streptomycetaceae bacterium NBC_01309]